MRLGLLIVFLVTGSAWTNDLTGKPAAEMVSKSYIAKLFDVDEAVIFESRLNRETILFSWEKPDAEAIRKRNKEILEQSRRLPSVSARTGSRQELQRDRCIVHISYSLQESEATAERIVREAFNQESQKLGRVDHGKTESYRVHYDVPLKRLGDRAAWSTDYRQLTIQKGRAILHLNLDITQDAKADLKKGKKLAKKILNQLP